MDRTLCYENSNEIDENCQVPMRYDFVFGTFIRNASIPKGGVGYKSFNISSDKKFEFNTKSLKTISIGMDTKRADLTYFKAERSEKMFNIITLKIMKPIEGPQEIQIDLWIKFFPKNQIEVTPIVGARIFIVVP